VGGLEAGANDYVVKPAPPIEIDVRLQALVRALAGRLFDDPEIADRRARVLRYPDRSHCHRQGIGACSPLSIVHRALRTRRHRWRTIAAMWHGWHGRSWRIAVT
jgi:DNA-binding response OmpR family regulator